MRSHDFALFLLELAEDYFASYRRSREWFRYLNNGSSVSPDRLRKTLSNEKLIIDTESGIKLLDAGREKILKQFPLLEWRKQKWDHLWRVVMYDIPEKDRLKRDLLRRWLKRLGFGQWQISSWVSPHPITDRINIIFEKTGLQESCGIFIAQRISGISDQKFAESAWKLTNLNHKYQTILHSFDTGKRTEYLKILLDDPMLPEELLPKNWAWEELLKKTLAI